MNARLGVWIPLRQRRSQRLPVNLAGALGAGGATGIDVVVRDLAPHGFAVDLKAPLAVGTMVWLLLPGIGGLNARIARRDGRRHGCEFLVPIAAGTCADAAAAQQAVAA
ncbi:MAG: PilZ domain-containing protein [Sphingomonadaceae bacterium]|nr:PilZ domain-containing protein [Sphingomonadaceae bacterium]